MIDWKCMFCCSQARYQCFGGKYWFCKGCHGRRFNMRDIPKLALKDCHGINCPLGIPHPPPSRDPSQGGAFPLGCSICRSEKLARFENKEVQQVATSSDNNLPKAYIYNARKPMKGVVYPEIEA